jgi:hypothetical protein
MLRAKLQSIIRGGTDREKALQISTLQAVRSMRSVSCLVL